MFEAKEKAIQAIYKDMAKKFVMGMVDDLIARFRFKVNYKEVLKDVEDNLDTGYAMYLDESFKYGALSINVEIDFQVTYSSHQVTLKSDETDDKDNSIIYVESQESLEDLHTKFMEQYNKWLVNQPKKKVQSVC